MAIRHDVSLIIPAFNRGNLISETIDSALNQTKRFYEIIVVNDGATDNTLDVLRCYGDRIRVITTANLGVQSARNTGVAAAQTEWIALCDSDDLLETNYLEKILDSSILDSSCEIAFCNFITFRDFTAFPDKFSQSPPNFFDGSNRDNSVLNNIPHLYKRSVEFQPLFPSGMIFRKSFFERIGGYNVKFKNVGAEDWEFTLRAISEGNIAVYLDPLVRVRKHAGNDSADSMRMCMGEAQILEFGLKNHRGVDIYRKVILESIERRRRAAFDSAFAKGDFEQTLSITQLLNKKPTDFNFQAKAWIAKLPAYIRQPVWWLSQKINNINN